MMALNRGFGCRARRVVRRPFVVGCGMCLLSGTVSASESPEIDIPFRSSAHGISEIYFDTGSGFNPLEKSAETVVPTQKMAAIGVKYLVLTSPPVAGDASAVIQRVQDGAKNYWILRRDLLSGTR